MCRMPISDYPKTCTDGIANLSVYTSYDSFLGCATVSCANATHSSFSYKVCEPPLGSNAPEHFEFIPGYPGNPPNHNFTICIAGTCINDKRATVDDYRSVENFARGPDYRNTCASGETLLQPNTAPVSTTVEISNGYPYDHNVVFYCNTSGFTPTQYDWNFGDNTTWIDAPGAQIYHSFRNNGTYTVTCTAKNKDKQNTGTKTITVTTPKVPESGVNIAVIPRAQRLSAHTYNLSCQGVGAPLGFPESYVSGPNGQDHFNPAGETYTFSIDGEYTIYCLGYLNNLQYYDRMYNDRGWVESRHCYRNCESASGDMKLMITSQPVGDDPGAGSGLRLGVARMNGQTLSPQDREVIVNPGETISGSVALDYVNVWPSDVRVVLASTSTWGENAASFKDHGTVDPSKNQIYFNTSYVAPTTPGTYHIIFAFRAEVDAGDVMSMTNWAANPEVWNDGNDIADWNTSQIQEIEQNGKTLAPMKIDNGMKMVYVPATTIRVRVEGTPTNTTNTTNQITCYNEVNDIPATCDGGSITTDEKGGCRKIICATSSASMQVLACDKSGYFEMYKQTTTGTAIKKICIGSTCISNSGYARSSNYPICVNTRTNTTNQTNTTQPSADIRFVPLFEGKFPIDQNAAFECLTSGFNATNYQFTFGDGSAETRTVSDVFHKYNSPGTYTATCAATNGIITKSDSIQVPINSPDFSDYYTLIANSTQNGLTATFTCEEVGYNASIYLWSVSDENRSSISGTESADKSTFTYTFPAPGKYYVNCRAMLTEQKQWYVYYDDDGSYHEAFCSRGGYGQCFWREHEFNISITSTNQTNTCFNKVSELPTSCNTGTKTADTNSGTCRSVQCTASTGSVTAQACEKSDAQGKFFEIYKQSGTGTAPEVCFGNTCLKSGWGYQKGADFPVCTHANTTNPTNATNTSRQADLVLVSAFPHDHNYAFRCNAGFNATSYTFNYGDGATETKNVFDTFHSYRATGSKTVTCTATNGTVTASDTLPIQVTSPDPSKTYSVQLTQHAQSGSTGTWSCNAIGYTPMSSAQYPNGLIHWKIRQNGTDLPGFEDSSGWRERGESQQFSYTFANPGTYTVVCRAVSDKSQEQAQYYDGNSPNTYHTEYCRGGEFQECHSQFAEKQVSIVGGQSCQNTVRNIPATCTGGSIASDTSSGTCRTITCASGSNSIKVMACDKPDAGAKQYFEMYRQSATGSTPKVCIGQICIQNEGYAKSTNYPICS